MIAPELRASFLSEGWLHGGDSTISFATTGLFDHCISDVKFPVSVYVDRDGLTLQQKGIAADKTEPKPYKSAYHAAHRFHWKSDNQLQLINDCCVIVAVSAIENALGSFDPSAGVYSIQRSTMRSALQLSSSSGAFADAAIRKECKRPAHIPQVPRSLPFGHFFS